MALFLDIYVVFNFNSLKDNEMFQISNQGQVFAYFLIVIDSVTNPFHIPHNSQSSGFVSVSEFLSQVQLLDKTLTDDRSEP